MRYYTRPISMPCDYRGIGIVFREIRSIVIEARADIDLNLRIRIVERMDARQDEFRAERRNRGKPEDTATIGRPHHPRARFPDASKGSSNLFPVDISNLGQDDMPADTDE